MKTSVKSVQPLLFALLLGGGLAIGVSMNALSGSSNSSAAAPKSSTQPAVTTLAQAKEATIPSTDVAGTHQENAVVPGPKEEIKNEIESYLLDHDRASRQSFAAVVQRPWGELQAEVEETVIGSGFNDDQFVRETCQLDENGHAKIEFDGERVNPNKVFLSELNRLDLQDLADSYNLVLDSQSREAAQHLRAALSNQIVDGSFTHVPIGASTTETLANAANTAVPKGGHVYVDTFTLGGWAVTFRVDSVKYPDYGAAMGRLEQLLHERDRALQLYVAALD